MPPVGCVITPEGLFRELQGLFAHRQSNDDHSWAERVGSALFAKISSILDWQTRRVKMNVLFRENRRS